MHLTTKPVLSKVCWPLIKLCEFVGEHFPATMVRMRYLSRFHRLPNLKNPQDLNEKILWQKLYGDTSRWTELADKYQVRKYVESLGLGHLLVKLYGAWSDENDVDFASLPNSLIFKANNGEGKGTNLVVKDLKSQDKDSLRKLFHHWLNRRHIGALAGEPHYKGMKPMVIAEKLLPIPEGEASVVDYKIWCINGKPRYIWVCNDRDKRGGGAAVMTYDTSWTPRPEYSVFNEDYRHGDILPKPANLDKMLEYATQLSAEFPILRVDLYNIDGQIFFGELTFTSLGGMMDFFTPEFLDMMGREADISQVKHR